MGKRAIVLALTALCLWLGGGASVVLADSVSYTYDALGRLVRATYDNGATIVYNYDGAGNRTSVVVTGVVGGIFHGHVTLPGRPAPPDPTWQVLLQVSFLLSGTSTVVLSATPTTDSSGAFAVSNVPPGTYDVQIKYALALSKLTHNAVVLVGDNPVHDFGPLAMGDVNNDDGVDLLDFSILRTTYGRCIGDAGYDGRADLNGDGCVDILDFSMLRTNFGQFGPQPG